MRSVRFHLLSGAAVLLAMTLGAIGPATAQSGARTEAVAPSPESHSPTSATNAASAPAKPAEVGNVKPSEPAAETAKGEPTKTGSKAEQSELPKSESGKTETAKTEPAKVEPAATAAADSPDTQLAEKLREMASGKFDRILGGKKERAGIEAFYGARNFAPLWVSNGAWNVRAKQAIAYLAHVDADGLEPSDYVVPHINSGDDPQALAEAEMHFTQTVMTYAKHAMSGRVHWSRVAADILYEPVKVDPNDVLRKLADSPNVAAVLDSFEPQHPGYKALKAKLAEARASKGGAAPARLSHGIVLRYVKDKAGKEILMKDPRVPLLRERLGAEGDRSDTTYDRALSGAVAKFQKAHGLSPSGQLTSATVDAINGPKRDRDEDIIIANLERWRWMPHDLGKDHVIVNIPDYTLRLIHDGKLYWQTRVVVGQPRLPTPITSAEMKYITVNPTWNVPPSIIQNEYLPALQQDPNAMERIGLKVVHNPDGTIRIYQPPGDRNALGRIRFNFPNKFLVYQHDTPDKHLFAHAKRAYSHGCMRVQDPLKYGEMLLSIVRPGEGYTQDRLHKMFGGSEVNINFPTFLPVHLTYQTAFVDDEGKLQIRDDVYGRDARLLAILKGPERKVADVPVERARGGSGKPVRAPAGVFWGGGPSGPSFFERLFGAHPTPPPQRVPQRAARSNNRDVIR